MVQAGADPLNPLQMLSFAADVHRQLERQQDVGLGEDRGLLVGRGLGEAKRGFHVAATTRTPRLRSVLVVHRQDVQVGSDAAYPLDEGRSDLTGEAEYDCATQGTSCACVGCLQHRIGPAGPAVQRAPWPGVILTGANGTH